MMEVKVSLTRRSSLYEVQWYVFRNEINLVFIGPSHWGEEYHACIGKHQSPINIEEHNVKNVSLPSLRLIGIENPYQSYVTNNGHTGENFARFGFAFSMPREKHWIRHYSFKSRFPRINPPLGNPSRSRSRGIKSWKTLRHIGTIKQGNVEKETLYFVIVIVTPGV